MTKIEKIIKEIHKFRKLHMELNKVWTNKCPSDLQDYTQKVLRGLKKYRHPLITWENGSMCSEEDIEDYLGTLQTWIEETIKDLERGPLKQEKEKLERLLQKIENCENYYLPLV